MTATGAQRPTNTGKYKEKIPEGYSKASINKFDQPTMDLYERLHGYTGEDSYTARLAAGDEDIFNEIEAPQMRKFEALMGQMGSRFSGMGMGARKGSGFNIEGTNAANEFQQDLASKRQELQRNAVKDLYEMSQMLMGNQPQEQQLIEKPKKWWEEAATAFAGGAGKGIGEAGTAAAMAAF
jgi:hypothetical protein